MKNALLLIKVVFGLLIKSKSSLRNSGWLRSVFERVPVDGDGNAIPWYNYSIIHVLNSTLTSDLTVFEYGAGNSTEWYSRRVKKVVSCEHHAGWIKLLLARNLPENCSLIHRELDAGYASAASETGELYDVIVIDGRKRNECACDSLKCLSDKGVIIWDNTDREEYQVGMEFIREHGFKELSFIGLAPIVNEDTQTTIFYRANNCLNI